jgi:hypothetical protein
MAGDGRSLAFAVLPLVLRAGSVCLCGLGLLGCQQELDMAKDYDDRNAATTIRYTGFREVTRQYPDYGVIRGTILSSPAARGTKERASP